MKNFSIIRIVDDNEEFRDSEAFMLRMLGYNVLSYESAQRFLEDDDPTIPGCVLLDVQMPEMDGLELQQLMADKSIGLPVIFLTGHGDVQMAVQTLHRGASDFLTKPATAEQLKNSIARALEQDKENRSKAGQKEEALKLYRQLTDREKEVCKAVAQGKLNKQIAFDLGITEHTVKVHRASAKYKLRVNTPIDFVNFLKLIGEA